MLAALHLFFMWFGSVQVLAEEIRAAGGIVTAQDLELAQPGMKQPITTKV